MAHLITTSAGVVTPVGIEQAAEELDDVQLAAAVGVGPIGVQVVVVVAQAPHLRAGLASLDLCDRVRERVGHDVAAVLVVRELPVDIRHNSKIDRARIALWATRVLAGDGSARL